MEDISAASQVRFSSSRATPLRSAPSIIEPRELSGRPDSSRRMPDDRRKVDLVPDAPEPVKTEASSVDKALVDAASAWISAKVAATLKAGAIEVGEYLLATFFGGDPARARSRNPQKAASFRALAERCGTAELPVSRTWLNNAVGIALMSRNLPAGGAFRELPVSYQEVLLPLRDSPRIESLATEVSARRLSYREFRALVLEERSKSQKRTGGRRATARRLARRLERASELVGPEPRVSGVRGLEVEALDEADKKRLLLAAERLIGRLTRLATTIRESS